MHVTIIRCSKRSDKTYPVVASISMSRGLFMIFASTLLSFPSKSDTEIRFDEDSVQNIRRPIQSIAILLTFAFCIMTSTFVPLMCALDIWLLFSKYSLISTVSIPIAVLL